MRVMLHKVCNCFETEVNCVAGVYFKHVFHDCLVLSLFYHSSSVLLLFTLNSFSVVYRNGDHDVTRGIFSVQLF